MLSINVGHNNGVIQARHAMGMAILCAIPVLLHFCTLFLNPHLDLEPDYITIKQMKHRFQRCIVRTEILSTKSPLVTVGCSNFHPSLRRSPAPSIHPSLDQPHSPPQTASGSSQPFCHNTLCRQTDRLTDRQMVQANIPYYKRSARHSERVR